MALPPHPLVRFTSLRNHLGVLLFLSTILSRWFAGGKWGEGEREMVPWEVINSAQICHAAKGLILSLIWGSFRIVMEENTRARAHTHTHTHTHTSLNPHKWNPLFGEASYRKLTYAEELANLSGHIRVLPTASVTAHTNPGILGLILHQPSSQNFRSANARMLHSWGGRKDRS